ncbi:unnamed protein product [Paramecium sonneborni]|uniref:Uncharacterized protein n=1 Tax=Paramecium sonneborni TaxID=65129 RepID=A0A8S1MAL0_9CILI|nr:unnamed protein product [Paramecium sonneborni]
MITELGEQAHQKGFKKCQNKNLEERLDMESLIIDLYSQN